MERISSHLADLSAMCSAGGLAAGSQWAAYLREHMLDNNQRLTGSRFLRKINAVGGLKRNSPDEALIYAMKRLEPFKAQFQEWSQLVLNSESFLDRLEGAGALSREQALRLGIVGPPARGSGVDRDIRRDFSDGIYNTLNFQPSGYTEGDALARLKVRIDEVKQSFEYFQKLVEIMPQADKQGVLVSPDAPSFCSDVPSVGVLESAKGELIHWIMMGPGNIVSRWHVRSASYMNWRGMIQATMGNNIVPDGPLVNKSFNLCYACVDR
jgi:Ni,Fe-hydrogenase III large subunit